VERRRRTGVSSAQEEPLVPVMNLSGRLQIHGTHSLPPGEWSRVPSDLARRLVGDPNYTLTYRGAGFQPVPGVSSDSSHPMVKRIASIGNLIGGFQCGGWVPANQVRQQTVTTWPNVLVVVPVYNCPSLLKTCSRSLATTKYGGKLRVVWIDNGSTDKTMARSLANGQYGESIRLEPGRGFAGAINEAVSGADEQYYVLLNQDCELTDPLWLEALIRWTEIRPACAVAGAKLLYPNGRLQHAGLYFPVGSAGLHRYRGMEPNAANVSAYERVSAVTGALMAIRASTWNQLGGLDAAYRFGYEDVDFCLKVATKLGLEVWYVPDATATHIDNAVRNSSAEIQERTRKWSKDGETLFRGRWGEFVDRAATGEVALLLPTNRREDARSKQVWSIANMFINAGQESLVYTYDGEPPNSSFEPVLFDTRRIFDGSSAETLIVTGWETVGVAKGIKSARRLYLATSDESSAARYLGYDENEVRLTAGREQYSVILIGPECRSAIPTDRVKAVLPMDMTTKPVAQWTRAILGVP